jgi:predicted nucleotide-binding protein (sugar kinase/HSP70/actin superfamily)
MLETGGRRLRVDDYFVKDIGYIDLVCNPVGIFHTSSVSDTPKKIRRPFLPCVGSPDFV